MATGRGGSKKKQGNAHDRKWNKAEERKGALLNSTKTGQSRYCLNYAQDLDN